MRGVTALALLLATLVQARHLVEGFEDKPSSSAKKIEMDCNPNLGHQYDVCPKNFCCVKDEFLPSYVYCRRISSEGESCTTRPSVSECGCEAGFYCKPNINSLTFQSFYGKCTNSSQAPDDRGILG